MFEILVGRGLGAILFGMLPKEVEDRLGEAPISEFERDGEDSYMTLVENFGSATINGRRITAVGLTTGANGRVAKIRTVWQVGYDGSVKLITAVPAKR